MSEMYAFTEQLAGEHINVCDYTAFRNMFSFGQSPHLCCLWRNIKIIYIWLDSHRLLYERICACSFCIL